MSKLENNPAWDEWEELEREIFTPEEIAASNVRVALTGELIKACKEGKITEKKLEEIEDIEEPDSWYDEVLRVLFSLGLTIAIVPAEQNKAS